MCPLSVYSDFRNLLAFHAAVIRCKQLLLEHFSLGLPAESVKHMCLRQTRMVAEPPSNRLQMDESRQICFDADQPAFACRTQSQLRPSPRIAAGSTFAIGGHMRVLRSSGWSSLRLASASASSSWRIPTRCALPRAISVLGGRWAVSVRPSPQVVASVILLKATRDLPLGNRRSIHI